MRKLVITEAPFNLGLVKKASVEQPGVNRFPAWLKQHGLYQLLNPQKIFTIDSPSYRNDIDIKTGISNTSELIRYSKNLSISIQDTIQNDFFNVVLGGDCSILVGCVHALKSISEYGLFFIDGHTDYICPIMSQTKAAAGMDLALSTGWGHESLTNMDGLKPYIKEKNVLAFGNRFQNDAYLKPILQSEITYYGLPELRQKGIKEIIGQFLNHMIIVGLDGFWIHLDVDVLDDAKMPCVDSRQNGGLKYNELKQVLSLLLMSPLAKGIDITIFDPDLDPQALYVKQFIKEIGPILTYGLD